MFGGIHGSVWRIESRLRGDLEPSPIRVERIGNSQREFQEAVSGQPDLLIAHAWRYARFAPIGPLGGNLEERATGPLKIQVVTSIRRSDRASDGESEPLERMSRQCYRGVV